jgi:hypothetical protein
MRLHYVTALAVALATSSIVPSTASAQAPASDPVKEEARKAFKKGVDAFDAGKYDEARNSFALAYGITKAAKVLLNLGLSEVRGGKFVDGGNHLAQFLREAKDATPDEKRAASEALETVNAKVTALTIAVDVAGAEVSIDGLRVGTAPLPGPVYVEPGNRTVFATANGKSALAKVDAVRGRPSSAAVTILAPAAPPAPPPAPTSVPTTPPQGTPAPATSSVPPSAAPTPGAPPSAMPPAAPPPASSSGRVPFLQWYKAKPLAWVGTGLAGVGLGLGAVFTGASSASASDIEYVAGEIRNQAASDGVTGAPCGPIDGGGSGDVYPDACGALRDAIDVHDANNAVAVTGWVVGGLALAGTATYVVLDWYLAKPSDAPASGAVQFGVVPIVSPTFQGAGVVGQF